MSESIPDFSDAARLAGPHLPKFSTITGVSRRMVFDPSARGRRKSVLWVTFRFPGATAEGHWREDLPEMATIAADDYERYQALKMAAEDD